MHEVVAGDSQPLEPIPGDGSPRSDDRDSHQRRSDRIAWTHTCHRRSNLSVRPDGGLSFSGFWCDARTFAVLSIVEGLVVLPDHAPDELMLVGGRPPPVPGEVVAAR